MSQTSLYERLKYLRDDDDCFADIQPAALDVNKIYVNAGNRTLVVWEVSGEEGYQYRILKPSNPDANLVDEKPENYPILVGRRGPGKEMLIDLLIKDFVYHERKNLKRRRDLVVTGLSAALLAAVAGVSLFGGSSNSEKKAESSPKTLEP